VYLSPPGWNPSVAPGVPAGANYLPDLDNASFALNHFNMFAIEVPSPYNGDEVMALLPSRNGLLVVMRGEVHGIYGSYPAFSQSPIEFGIGCLDRNSAFTSERGSFFCGRKGVFRYNGTGFDNLTENGVRREWEETVRNFDPASDSITAGEAHGKLLVSTRIGGSDKTWCFDMRLGSWSTWSNSDSNYYFSCDIPGEDECLLASDIAGTGRIANLKPAADLSGDYQDDNGSGPSLIYWTGTAIGKSGGVEGEMHFDEVVVHSNLYDTGADGATDLNVSVVVGGSEFDQENTTILLNDVESDSVDRIDRHPLTIRDDGRLLQVRIETGTIASTLQNIEIPQLVIEVEDQVAGT